MTDTPTTTPFLDGSGTLRSQLSVQNAQGQVSPQVALRSDGVPVSAAAPLPVTVGPAVVGVAPLVSAALEGSHVFSVGACLAYSVYVAGVSADCWLLGFDAVSAPADGAVLPKLAAQVSGGWVTLDFPAPLALATGLVLVLSSSVTPFIKTSGPTGFFAVQVR